MITTHTVTSFDKELHKLTQEILSMGELVKELIGMAVDSLERQDEELARLAKASYKKISELEVDVEKESTALLALWQPKAVDLRFITASLKISSLLESMGSLAHNTVKRASRVTSQVPGELMDDFKKVASIVASMLEEVLKALEASDAERADRVWVRDDEVDEIYKLLFNRLQAAMQENAADIPSCLQIAFAAKNFEKIGDFATKLARSVHYVVLGKRPKKQKVKAALAG